MALKKRLNASEQYGLTFDQVKEAERYLRAHKTAGILNDQEGMPLMELYLLGYTFEDIHQRYPNVAMGKILLTAALKGWVKHREHLASSVFDRIKARIIKSTVDQVELLTDMITVYAKEASEETAKYLKDPKGNPLPNQRIHSLKEFQVVAQSLADIAESVKVMAVPVEAQPGKPKLVTAAPSLNQLTEEQSMLAALADGSTNDK